MNNSNMLTIMAHPGLIFVLASCAHAACSSAAKEADWSETADAFLDGRPMSDEPIAFGPKAARAAILPIREKNRKRPGDG